MSESLSAVDEVLDELHELRLAIEASSTTIQRSTSLTFARVMRSFCAKAGWRRPRLRRSMFAA